jgi:chemotaxis protein MotB
MRRKRRTEEPDNADRWVVSYADFVTLLFAFFTTLYAISHVDAGKLEKFSGSMKSALKSGAARTGGSGVIEGIKPINYRDAELEKDIRSVFEKSGILGDVSISRSSRGVFMSFGDAALFDPGSADLKPEAQHLLTVVASVVRQTQNPISIEGHTDNTPIRGSRYTSNWELSTARAVSVLASLVREYGLPPERFSASGYGEFRPIASNASPDGRAKNRRVDIILDGEKEGR